MQILIRFEISFNAWKFFYVSQLQSFVRRSMLSQDYSGFVSSGIVVENGLTISRNYKMNFSSLLSIFFFFKLF